MATGSGQVFVQKKITGAAVEITILPEPATLAILAFGGLLLRKRLA
jgi:hypothetical protein